MIARRALRIATESVVTGMGMSVAGMAAASAGLLPPAWGALAQELIDVAVILNALRVLRGQRAEGGLGGAGAALARRFSAEHAALRPDVEAIRTAADAIGTATPAEALRLAREAHRMLSDEVVPHELAEDAELYPVLARALGGTDPTGTMSRAHAEIAHQSRRLGRLLAEIGSGDADPEDLLELRRALYGLHAILALHFAQEDESYLSLAEHTEPM